MMGVVSPRDHFFFQYANYSNRQLTTAESTQRRKVKLLLRVIYKYAFLYNKNIMSRHIYTCLK